MNAKASRIVRFPLALVAGLVAITLLFVACGGTDATPTPTPTSTPIPTPFFPRNLTVLVGAGQDTAVIRDFLPSNIRIRVGDTVTWRFNGDPAADADPSTVTFTSGGLLPEFFVPRLGGASGELMFNPLVNSATRVSGALAETYNGTGYVNSGFLSGQPLGLPMQMDMGRDMDMDLTRHGSPVEPTIDMVPQLGAPAEPTMDMDAADTAPAEPTPWQHGGAPLGHGHEAPDGDTAMDMDMDMDTADRDMATQHGDTAMDMDMDMDMDMQDGDMAMDTEQEDLALALFNETFSLTFDTPGTYEYIDLVHPFIKGTIAVVSATSTDVPSQAEIDAQVQERITILLAQIAAVEEAGLTVGSEPGPAGTTVWFVQAGGLGSDPVAELTEFLPKDLTIREGDTVIWTSDSFHNVAFHPGRMHPLYIVPIGQDDGPTLLTANSEVVFPSKPSDEFEGTGFWTSGLIGSENFAPVTPPGGTIFSMTFTRAGIYDYMCAIHRPLGMEGTITVVPR